MTVTYGFYNSVNNDRRYDAVQMSKIFDGIIADGVYQTIGNCFAVTPGTALTLNVDTGRAWFNHTWTLNDAIIILSVTAADMVNPRIDTVVLEVNEGTRINTIKMVDGTPAGSPVHPTLTNTSTIHQYPLADLRVNVGDTGFIQADITNRVGTADCPYVTGLIDRYTTDQLVAQWESEFDTWFATLNTQLSGEVAANLQAQINSNIAHVAEGRLTLLSDTPVPTSAVTLATTVYYTPYVGNRIALRYGGIWRLCTFSQLSWTLPASANTNLDIFASTSDGTTVSLSTVAWTNDTTRAQALTYTDGVLGLSNGTSRYLGSVRMSSSAGYSTDSVQYRYVWNMYNRVPRNLYISEWTAHTYTTAAWQGWRNSYSTGFYWICGQPTLMSFQLTAGIYDGATVNANFAQPPSSGNACFSANLNAQVTAGIETSVQANVISSSVGTGNLYVSEYGSATADFTQVVLTGVFDA